MIILEGKPQSTNNLYRTASRNNRVIVYMTGDGKITKALYQFQAREQWHKPIIIGDLEVTIRLYFTDNRRRDWDNWHKISMDSLSGIVWKDDQQIRKATVEKFIDKKNPRIEIDIKS